ncbi:MAG: PepSY-like domain-containing protein, partial [bacterium]
MKGNQEMKTNRFLNQIINVIFAISLFSAISNISMAQEKKYSEKDIPSVVMESFKKLYPNAVITGYDVDNKKSGTTYEIESKDGSVQRDVEFTSTGNVTETGESISVNTLPANITSSIESKFNSAKILEAEKKIRGTEILYEVVIEHKNKKRELLINQNG